MKEELEKYQKINWPQGMRIYIKNMEFKGLPNVQNFNRKATL
jgi:hypothetical protein